MSPEHKPYRVHNGKVYCRCDAGNARVVRRISGTDKNPDRPFYSHNTCGFFRWEDGIPELFEFQAASSQPGVPVSTPLSSIRLSQTEKSPYFTSLPADKITCGTPSSPDIQSPTIPLSIVTMNGLSTPSATPVKNGRVSTGGSASRKFDDPQSQARRLAAIKAVTGEAVEENQASQNRGMQTDLCDSDSEYGMEIDEADDALPRKLGIQTGNDDSPMGSPTKMTSDALNQLGSSNGFLGGASVLSPPPSTSLPDIFGIHEPKAYTQENDVFSTDGERYQTPPASPSKSRLISMTGSSSVKPAFDASQTSQTAQSAMPTPLSHTIKMQKTEDDLDDQVQAFISAAERMQAGAELVRRLRSGLEEKEHELRTKDHELRNKDHELTEAKKQLKDLSSKYKKVQAAMKAMLEKDNESEGS